jgi:hypothetical protein
MKGRKENGNMQQATGNRQASQEGRRDERAKFYPAHLFIL